MLKDLIWSIAKGALSVAGVTGTKLFSRFMKRGDIDPIILNQGNIGISFVCINHGDAVGDLVTVGLSEKSPSRLDNRLGVPTFKLRAGEFFTVVWVFGNCYIMADVADTAFWPNLKEENG